MFKIVAEWDPFTVYSILYHRPKKTQYIVTEAMIYGTQE